MLAPPSQQPEQSGTINGGPIASCVIRSAVPSGMRKLSRRINAHPTKLWQSVDQLLGRAGRVPMTSSIDVETINSFFADKVAKVHASATNAPSPTFTDVPAGSVLREPCPLSIDDVISSV